MKATIQAVKGTREFYPETMAVRQWLCGKIRQVSESFGYQEWDGPFLEKIDLYAAKSGEELVKEQAFVFPDRGGDMITLRPELTPSLARLIAQKQNELVYPLRWWSFGPFWRYEKPQKGRTREFFQWNCDLIGVNSADADAELVAIAATFLKTVGYTPEQVKIKLNHRKLMEKEIYGLGIDPATLKSVFRMIDRRDKMSVEAWKNYGSELGLSTAQMAGLTAILADVELWKKSPELTRIFDALKIMGIADYVAYDPQIIRGLDYYTGIVFEAWDMGGDGRAVLGGGHYDNLVADVGGEPLPGVGFAMGDVMMTILLEKYGLLPQSSQLADTVLVTVFDDSLTASSIETANLLRQEGIKAICYPEAVKLPKQFKYADRMGIRVVVVIGPDEAAAGKVTVKDLGKGEQKTIALKDLIAEVRAAGI
jgi:histidyl-tRNA synthetase